VSTAVLLFLAFTVIPAAELFLLLEIGSFIGPLPTFAMVLGMGVLGAWLARREGSNVWRQLTTDLATGLPPQTRLLEAALVVAGGVLLVTPGVLTDVVGMVLLFPPTRRLVAPWIGRWLASRFGGAVQFGPGRPAAEGTTEDGVRYRDPRRSVGAAAADKPFGSKFD
jgi:UPF0716 protein FxsA